MNIANNTVVAFHYTLTVQGTERETSVGKKPMLYLHGAANLIPGLAKAFEGRAKGDKFAVTVPPEEAYGQRSLQVERVPRKHFANVKNLHVGQVLNLDTRQGQQVAVVKKIGMTVVDIDRNHPLAGETLHFDVEIANVRAASEDEIAHGHAHSDDHGDGVAH
jgi:FKBP-type peptidyl-prolyl cis-trans isomerase SlyD